MKKTYPASRNARSRGSYSKHLRPDGKRRVNKSTRRLTRDSLSSLIA